MTIVLLLIKASVVVALVATAQSVIGRRTSAATRHLVWVLTIVGLLALPVLSSVLPGWRALDAREWQTAGSSAALPESAAVASTDTEPVSLLAGGTIAADLSKAATVPWSIVFSGLYVLGVCVLLTRLAAQHLSIRRLENRAVPVTAPEWVSLLDECGDRLQVRQAIRLLRSREQTMPMTFGMRRPTVLLPAVADTWSDDRRRAVLQHELAHIARRDCLMQLVAAVACAFYWVHPGVWWIARRLRVERELACDDYVISAGADADDYAHHLLELAYTVSGQRAPAFAVGMAGSQQLEARIRALLDRARNRGTPSLKRLVASAAGLAVVFVIIATASTQDAPQPSQTPTPPTTNRSADTKEPRLSVEDLIRAHDHGVTPEYIVEMQNAGYPGLSFDMLVKAHDHGISAEYVQELKELGFELSFDDLIKTHDHGVDAEYIRALSDLGYTSLSIDDIIRLHDHGVTPDFIQELNELGYVSSVDQLTSAIDHAQRSTHFHGDDPGHEWWRHNLAQFEWHFRCAAGWVSDFVDPQTSHHMC